jgi:Cu+-exporting ATPase
MASDGVDERTLVQLAASLERASEHPLAAAIVSGAGTRDIPLVEAENFRSVTAGGVAGHIKGRAVLVGKAKFVEAEGVPVSPAIIERANGLQAEGKTVLFVAIDGRFAGLLAVADPIKATTVEAIDELHALGIKLVMATGDNRRTAEAVAQRLGLDRFEAEVEPAEKIRLVETLQKDGARVAMAGDGINDAPALAAASVGIAMGTGTDVAMESAGVTLVKGDLRGIAKAIHLSRATMKNIRQNLFFAFIYNVLGVPIAAGVLYPVFGLLLSPIIAGAAMSLSSVSVITNALRLKNVRL